MLSMDDCHFSLLARAALVCVNVLIKCCWKCGHKAFALIHSLKFYLAGSLPLWIGIISIQKVSDWKVSQLACYHSGNYWRQSEMYLWKLYIHVTLHRCWCPRRIALLSMSSSSRRESWWPRKMSIWPSIPSLLTRMCPTFMWWKQCRWETDRVYIFSQAVHSTAGERLCGIWAVEVRLVLTSASGQCCHLVISTGFGAFVEWIYLKAG